MSSDERRVAADLRWGVYAILIAVAAGNMTGRLLAVNAVNRAEMEKSSIGRRVRSLEERLRQEGLSDAEIAQRVQEKLPDYEAAERRQRPFLSSNDRSRWLAIRALVDHGTFELDEVIDRHVWNTIDMVQHKNRDGEPRLYSSKPPLLITLLAGEYWLLQQLTGWTLAEEPYAVGRTMLITVNVLPMMLLIALAGSLAERFGTTDWGRIFVVASAALGTLLMPFAVVLNNHTVAAVSTAVALVALVRIWFDESPGLRWHVLCGLATAFTAANDLPALAMVAGFGLVSAWRHPRGFLLGYLPAVAVVVAAFFATNYWAHDSFRPPYMHRSETDSDDNWYEFTYTLEGRERQSYWSNPQGIDRGEPCIGTYAFHVLVGHHGIFSLTPIWLLSVWGAGVWIAKDRGRLRWLAAGIVTLTVICLIFYIVLRPERDRNYGGMTSGFRWMFWFIPLWLTTMIPAADHAAQSRSGRWVALILLGFSVFSASYPTWNPWMSPWIQNAIEWWFGG